MNKRWLIDITEQDIAAGKPSCPTLCPLAIALHRAIGKECKVAVQSCGVRVYFPNGSSYLWYPSSRLARWVQQFDLERAVRPGRFSLTIPKIAAHYHPARPEASAAREAVGE